MTTSSVRVPLVDLTAQFASLRDELMPRLESVLASGHLFLGPYTQRFEEAYAAYCGTRTAITVGNGTEALHLALRAAGIGPGDEVITVANTFIATVEAIVQVGARPVLVDSDPRTFVLDPALLEKAITPRTRAIIPVHLFGRLADMDAIGAIARQRNVLVIEDASQAQGAATADGRRAGSIGVMGCFSFYYAKNLGAYGEAGAITTSDPELERRIRVLRSHGESVRYHHTVMGFNSRADEIQCAVLDMKLPYLDRWNAARRAHAARYDALLADLPVTRPEQICGDEHVYHQYVIRTPQRDRVREALDARGIGTGIHYPIPVHLQPASKDLGYGRGDFPESERAADEMLSLPMYPELTEVQIDAVVSALRDAVSSPRV